MRRGAGALGAALVGLVLAGVRSAQAQDLRPTAEGVSRYAQGDLEGALARFRAAEAEAGLRRDELLVILQYRATIHHGLGAIDARDEALAQLATLEPAFTPLEIVPPAVRERLAAVVASSPGPLRLSVSAQRVSGEVHVGARVDNDAGLLRSLLVETSLDGGGWEVTPGPAAVIECAPSQRVFFRVAAVGPGGVWLAFEEGAVAPLDVEPAQVAPPANRLVQTPEPHSPRAEQRRSSTWVWVGIAAGVVLVAGGVAAFVALSADETNQVEAPTVVSW